MDVSFWPRPSVFLDVSVAMQLGDGRARCIGIAICDAEGRLVRVFNQGQPAHFFYEFEILDDIDVPSGGLEFHDADGHIIHGKSSLQYGTPAPRTAKRGTRLLYHHAIGMEVAVGEYWLTIGLASTEEATYIAYQRESLSYQELVPRLCEHCRVVDAGSFQVCYDPSGRLLHHGIANLPGSCWLISTSALSPEPHGAPKSHSAMGAGLFAPRLSHGISRKSARIWRRLPFFGDRRSGHMGDVELLARDTPKVVLPPAVSTAIDDPTPAIFHVTHWKAGSQWIYKILKECSPERIVEPRPRELQFLRSPLHKGKVYPTVYVTKQQFESVALPPESRRFVIIRDLRDTLVSAYFSTRYSHAILEQGTAQMRVALEAMSIKDGLIHKIDELISDSARIQLSWLEAGEPLIRYEDLLEHDLEILERVLLDECQLPVTRERFREAVLSSRFEQLTKERRRGQEQLSDHNRKGIAGDWRNYFTDRVKQAFKARYGGLLVATGYEQHLSW